MSRSQKTAERLRQLKKYRKWRERNGGNGKNHMTSRMKLTLATTDEKTLKRLSELLVVSGVAVSVSLTPAKQQRSKNYSQEKTQEKSRSLTHCKNEDCQGKNERTTSSCVLRSFFPSGERPMLSSFFIALHVRGQVSFYLCRSKQPPTQIKAHSSQVLRGFGNLCTRRARRDFRTFRCGNFA